MLPQDKGHTQFADPAESATASLVEVTHSDANVILHERQFNFM